MNEINVNNEVFPNERDAGPLTAVTDLWMQIRELPVLGIVRIGNQKDCYGFEEDGRQLVHLGMSGRTIEPQRRAPRYDTTTGDPLGPTLPYTRFRSRPPAPGSHSTSDRWSLTTCDEEKSS